MTCSAKRVNVRGTIHQCCPKPFSPSIKLQSSRFTLLRSCATCAWRASLSKVAVPTPSKCQLFELLRYVGIGHTFCPSALSPSHSFLRVQLTKLTQKKWRIKLPKTKSAKARSWLMARNSAACAGSVCTRNEAVSTNWPTVAPKPARKALNG